MSKFNDNCEHEFETNDTYYVCAICGMKYKNIEGRINCEQTCLAERKQAEEAYKKQKLAEEKNKRMEEIREVYAKLDKLVDKYVHDYGTLDFAYAYKSNSNENNRFNANKLLGGWWW